LFGSNDLLKGYGLVILAAALWASLGLFYKQLFDVYGLSPLTAAFFRAALAAALIMGWLTLRGERVWRLGWRVVRFFAAFGVVGIGAFYLVYASAIDRVGVGVAAVLMYTAPVWVTVLSALFLGESWTAGKGAALALVMVGVALVARVYRPEALQFNVPGILMGLGAGLTYGLYILFGKVGVRRYRPMPMLGYALVFGAATLLPFQASDRIAAALTDPSLLPWLLGVAFVPTLLAGVSFNWGLHYLPASNASIVATLEPVIALILGALLLDEGIEPAQVVGAGLVLAAITMLNLSGSGSNNRCPT
jgi:DME family drug/metabolite transporter